MNGLCEPELVIDQSSVKPSTVELELNDECDDLCNNFFIELFLSDLLSIVVDVLQKDLQLLLSSVEGIAICVRTSIVPDAVLQVGPPNPRCRCNFAKYFVFAQRVWTKSWQLSACDFCKVTLSVELLHGETLLHHAPVCVALQQVCQCL